MNGPERQALLVRLKLSQSKIARDLGINPSAVSAVVAGRNRSQRIEREISEQTGTPLATLWPDWYGDEDDGLVVDAMQGPDLRESRGSYEPPPLGADAMALSNEERQVLHLMRAMTAAQRGRFVGLAKRVLLDMDESESASTKVTASGKKSRAAGRDMKG